MLDIPARTKRAAEQNERDAAESARIKKREEEERKKKKAQESADRIAKYRKMWKDVPHDPPCYGGMEAWKKSNKSWSKIVDNTFNQPGVIWTYDVITHHVCMQHSYCRDWRNALLNVPCIVSMERWIEIIKWQGS